MYDDEYGLIATEHVELFKDLLKRHGNGIVLDLGCGSRNPAGNKSDLVKTLICIDGSDLVKKDMDLETLPENTSFVLSDICNLPFEDNYANLVLMIGVYTSIPPTKLYKQSRDKFLSQQEFVKYTKESMLKEANRVLNRNGHLIASLRDHKSGLIIDQIKEFSLYFDIVKIHQSDDRERYLVDARSKK